MARRFVRVDLSQEARDYRPLALEPGVPLLDRSGANDKILFRWLGGMIAEPVWEGESVNFFVRDDHGGRLEEVACQPATNADLKGPLNVEIEKLRDRIDQAKPETATERAVKKMVRQAFEQFTKNLARADLDGYFFKYRDVQGRWRLVWCWGYQRVDQQPAPTAICAAQPCNLLFVRRPGQSPKCPACEAALATVPKKPSRGPARLVTALLLLVIAALALWYFVPNRLVATPSGYTGPVGSRIAFRVEKSWLLWRQDVTGQAVAVALDPAVARVNSLSTTATIVGPGTTFVRFLLGDLSTNVPLTAGLATNPDRLVIEPQQVELGIGTTARLKLIGEYDDGARVDLTEAAEWVATSDGIVFAMNGLVEGLGEGKTTVAARYRATPQDDYLEANAKVDVSDIQFESLRLVVAPSPVNVGRPSALVIDAVTAEGRGYSVLESSRLDTTVSPNYLARVDGRELIGNHVGEGKLTATFNETLTGELPLSVAVGPGVARLVVLPETLDMVVGQITDLSIASPSREPIAVTSADAETVEVDNENRLIARREGSTQVTVAQGNERLTVDVRVTTAEFASLAIAPSHVVVPVDDTVRPRAMAEIVAAATQPNAEDSTAANDSSPAIAQPARRVEIAPDQLEVIASPSPRFAQLYAPKLELLGVTPTRLSSPQSLSLRFKDHEATAPVEVVVAPLRLALTPPGPVGVPLGQQVRVQGWATYSGGRRVQVVTGRMTLDSREPADAIEGLELRGDRVAALKADAGPLEVYADYFGYESKPVVFRSTEAGPVTLKLNVDRTLRVANETGRAILSGTDPDGDVDLVPELATFTSSDPKVLKIDETSGMFRAVTPGKVTVTAEHPAAQESVSLELNVYDPADVRMVFDPSSVRLAVDEVARLPLYLEAKNGGAENEDTVVRAPLTGPSIGYTMNRPEAVRFLPPTLVGVEPAEPFELAASYYPVLRDPATAQIEVVAAQTPAALRVIPASVELVPGQTIALRVEQQSPDAPDTWKEVAANAVIWRVPSGVVWTPATEDLPPTVALPEGASGQFDLSAEYAGQTAAALITAKTSALDPNDPAAEVVLLRDPPGEYLPAGHQQRYQIAVRQGALEEPAADITWPDDFENDYVRWQAPVLTAKRGGYQQWLDAQVGAKKVIWQTSTHAPSAFQRALRRADQPIAVKILSDQGPVVRFPVGARFDDFRVEAHYDDGFTRVVTNKANIRPRESASEAAVAPSEGLLLGVQPGRSVLDAEFDGVRSEQPLTADVLAEVDVDQLRVTPAPLALGLGETYSLDVVGYKNGKSLGILTGVPGLLWKSTNPEVARADHSAVTGTKLGTAGITAQLGQVLSPPAEVNVVESVADALVTNPKLLQLRVGEGARIGVDVNVFRGDLDFSHNVRVTPALPGVVRYVPETHSLMGVSPGASAVAFSAADKLTNLTVEVLPETGIVDGTVVVEPATCNLAQGQAVPLSVFVVTSDGLRIDRTAAAVFSSAEPNKVAMRGNRACALQAGASQITAVLPGTRNSGTAYVSVNSEPITELILDPPAMNLGVGDLQPLRILGRAATGTHELFEQSDLRVTTAGPNPQAIALVGENQVDALSPGQAAVAVEWQNRLSAQAPVSVTNNPLTALRIDPAVATIHPGQPLVYQVTAMRGGELRVLGPEHGVKLFVSNDAVATPIGGMAVQGRRPGRTAVVAQVGSQQAEASLDVVPGTAAVGSDIILGPGGTAIIDGGGTTYYGPGGGYYSGGSGGWVDGVWRDDVIVRDGSRTVIGGPDYVDGVYHAPTADAVELRFVPEVLRLAPDSPPTPIRVFEVLPGEVLGREVTTSPDLEVGPSTNIAAATKTETGVVVGPRAAGQTFLGAKLGLLTAKPLLVQVGDVVVGRGRLIVSPNPLTIWSAETGTFDHVMLDPGGGLPPRAVDYRVAPQAGSDVVEVVDGRTLRGLRSGVAQVTVTVAGADGTFTGPSTAATVEVVDAGRLWIEPATLTMKVGQSSPPLSVMTEGPGGLPVAVAATLQSMDGAVVTPNPQLPGRFQAQGLGATQIRATYRGREAFADVTVTGDRFLSVEESYNGGPDDFDITLEVLAAPTEGSLEYRVYRAGDPPADNWVAADIEGEFRKATLRSPRMPYGPRGTLYNLVIEARDTQQQSIQRYPLTFRLTSTIERTDLEER